MAIKHDVIITDDRFRYLSEAADAFDKIKDDKKFIHIRTWANIGGNYAEIVSNDERVEMIKDGIMKEHERTSERWADEIRRLRDENEKLKNRGFFKRLFS